MTERFRAIIFDLDGTLADTLQDIAGCANECAALLGAPPIPAERYRVMIGDGLAVLAERVLGGADPARIEAFTAAFAERLPAWQLKSTRLYPGVSELLSSLAARGVPAAVLTNKPHALAELLLARIAPDVRFAAVAGQSADRPRKPDPAGVFAICEALGVPPAAVLYVGDSAVDMETGRRAGAPTAGVLWGFRSARELVDTGARFLAARPADLLACLDGLPPLQYLATERLVLRPALPGDIATFQEFWSDEEANRIDHGTSDAGAWHSRSVEHLKRLLRKRPSRTIWALLLPPALEIIGYVRLRRYSFLTARGTIALRLGRPWWSRGYATEALRAWCPHVAAHRRLKLLDPPRTGGSSCSTSPFWPTTHRRCACTPRPISRSRIHGRAADETGVHLSGMHPADIPPTELPNPRSARLDALSPRDAAALLIGEEARAAAALKGQAGAAAEIAVWAADSLTRGGRLIYIGAGTSGRLGVLDAVECVPTFRTDPRDVVAIIAGGSAALTRAVEGAEDDEDDGRAQVRAIAVDARDTVVGIAACGTTPFVLAALREAKARGAHTALVTAGAPRPEEFLDALVRLPSGPEVLTGSTRLKAGTATKIILNAISTTAMICMGKVYRNLMVDLRPTNSKLRARAVRLVGELAGTDAAAARAALEAARWRVKVAVLALRKSVAPDAAARLLAEHGGFLGKALGETH